MINILLACSAGFSTSILVERIKEVAHKRAMDISIISVGETDIENYLGFDILLVGPQIEHRFKALSLEYDNVPVLLINSYDYGTMNGEKVLDFALDALNAKIEEKEG